MANIQQHNCHSADPSSTPESSVWFGLGNERDLVKIRKRFLKSSGNKLWQKQNTFYRYIFFNIFLTLIIY